MISYANYIIPVIGFLAQQLSAGGIKARRASFALQFTNQLIWLVYGTATQQWGFVGGGIVFGAGALLGLWRLRTRARHWRPARRYYRRPRPLPYAWRRGMAES